MVSINFVGDIGIFRKFEELNIDPIDKVQLPVSDLNIGNFEFVIPREKKKLFYDVQEKYSCSFDYLEKLKVEKFQGLGIANNHSVDYGLEGAMDSITYLKKRGIKVFGFSDNTGYSVGEFEFNGIRIAVIACAKKGRWTKEKHGFGPDTYDATGICHKITEIKARYHHVIVFPHWGTELVEIPDAADILNAKKFIDVGASAVIGHHPHVPQGIELYKKGIIAYSLGSFIFLPDEVLGYTKDKLSQEVSICINIHFSENEIKSFKPVYYRYNKKTKIPEIIRSHELNNYPKFLNENIYNQKLFHHQVRKVLLKREFYSFLRRFKANPIKTVFNYLKIFKLKHLLKLIK